MEELKPYIAELTRLIRRAAPTQGVADTEQLQLSLDGEASRKLRSLVNIDKLRTSGAFFTGSELAQFALKDALTTINANSVIMDPACGGGDLLIAAARRLPTGEDLRTTLDLWADRIIARDIHKEFISIAKARVLLAAIERGIPLNRQGIPALSGALPHMSVGDGMCAGKAFRSATHILINPPFNAVRAPTSCDWATGSINTAALFMESCILNARIGTRIVAILPDVLRSGTRYQRWRRLVSSKMLISSVRIYGAFDSLTDVDVFVLDGTKSSSGEESSDKDSCWVDLHAHTRARITDKFKVSVGSVVDYRDAHTGPWHPFIDTSVAAPWQVINVIDKNRRFKGKTYQPPLVVVRRTSSPSDRYRIVASLIDVERPVAIENHLLVLQPKDHSLTTCKKFMDTIKRESSNVYMNERIRCRHLTVSALSEMPYEEVDL